MFQESKLKRDIDTVRESIRLSFVELEKSYSPDDRRSLIKHIEIFTGELARLISRAEQLGTVPNDCPMATGDRVRHEKFGEGSVVSVSGKMVSPDHRSPTGVRDAGWNITVNWDDPNRSQTAVAHWALRLLPTSSA